MLSAPRRAGCQALVLLARASQAAVQQQPHQQQRWAAAVPGSQPCLSALRAAAAWRRGLKTDAGAGPFTGPHASSSVQLLLDSMTAAKLRDSLGLEAEARPFMAYSELLDFIINHGAADTQAEAHAKADALVAAGVVLRFNGIVYLKPQEVSELVYRTLPMDAAHARRNLSEIEADLAEMDRQHRQLRLHAQRWPRFWLWTGCAALTLQLVGFTYLTYWELSWDVMEPIAYILSLTYSLLAYVYFLMTRGSYFDYGPFQEYWTQQLLEKRMSERGFDVDKYEHLLRARERYRRYLAAAAQQADGASGDSGKDKGA